MVGGKVIEVAPMRVFAGEYPGKLQNVLRIWCVDNTYSNDELAIYVEDMRDVPAPGDDVWWQGRTAYWSGKSRSFVDRPMKRVGYSFDPRRIAA